MSKFLYPIYKLKTKSYIKWWLYHKKAGGSGVLSEILQGFSFNLENTLNRKFKLFEIEGNSVQDGSLSPDNEVPIKSAGDNENLLDLNDIITTDYITNNGDGSITLNGTGSSGVSFPLKEPFTLKANNTYILSLTNTYSNYSAGTLILRNGNTNIFFINYNVSSVSYTPSQDIVIDTLRIYGGGVTFNNFTFKAKLERGNKATPYSPYGMGSITEKIGNKNIVNWAKNLRTSFGGITSVINADGSITTTGKPNYNYVSIIGLNITNLLKNGKTYTLSQKTNQGAKLYLQINAKNNTTGAMSYVTLRDATSKTFTADTENISYILNLQTGTTAEWGESELSITNYYQLEPGSTVSDFVPHEEQDYSIYTQQPFRSIGDVRDCFVNKDGSWYERHYFGKLEQLLDLVGPVEQGFYFIPQGIKKGAKLLSTHQQLGTKTASEEWQRFDGSQMKQLYPTAHNGVYINYKADTKQEQINWWNSLNATLLYELEIPLDLPCTETQIQQLENLPSTYKEMTIIQSEDETPAHLKIQYYKEG